MAIELIVFDLAGTTVKDDRDVHRALQKALLKFDIKISLDDANAVMGIPKPVAIRKLIKTCYRGNVALAEDWIPEIHSQFVNEMIEFYRADPSVEEKQGVSDTFRKLKQNNLKVAIDTGFDRQITESILERLGWQKAHLIDASATSDEVVRGRPYPDLIFRVMELTHVTDSRRVAKVGDTASDLQEGNSAGCGWVIGVTTGAYSKTELQKEKHTHLIENVHELLEIFNLNV